jgi:hypothetical protein
MGTDKARHWAKVPFSGSAVAASKTSEKQKAPVRKPGPMRLGKFFFYFSGCRSFLNAGLAEA